MLTLVCFVAVAGWVAAWSWRAWGALLDDSLIHLRYAENLRATGRFAYNVGTESFGSSSPAFDVALALAGGLGAGPALPKVLSTAGYLMLLVVVWRATIHGRSRPSWVPALWLTLALVSPLGLRWLTDGMETSWVVLLAFGLPVLVLRRREGRPEFAGSASLWLALGVLLPLLRIEFIPLVALLIVSVFVSRATPGAGRDGPKRAALVGVGVLVGVGILWLVFGHVVPDTAIAKGAASRSLWRGAVEVLRSLAAAGSLGLGLTMAWGVSLADRWRPGRWKDRIALALANSAVPALIALVAWNGLVVHGIRHLLWAFAFALGWNLARERPDERAQPSAPVRTLPQAKFAAAGALVLVGLWLVEAPAAWSYLASRSRLADQMASDNLGVLAGTRGAAFDIGLIGYFSAAEILDLSGLINGRSIAALSPAERVRVLLKQPPEFLFVTDEQKETVAPSLDLGEYLAAREYEARNLGSVSVYRLLVRRDAAAFSALSIPRDGPRGECEAGAASEMASERPSGTSE